MSIPGVIVNQTPAVDCLKNSAQERIDPSEIKALDFFLTGQEIDALVISRKALAAHEQNKESLTEDESDRLKLVARIISHVASTFGVSQVVPWLHEPFLRFGRRTPLELMSDHEGAEEIEEYLVQIDEGYFA